MIVLDSIIIIIIYFHLRNQTRYSAITYSIIDGNRTSLPKVIWEEGRVAAPSHTYAVKSPLVTMAAPNSPPKVPFPWSDPKPQYLPHPCTRPTFDAKRHPDPIRRFSTVHWTDRQTDRPTDRLRENLMTMGRCATRATRWTDGDRSVVAIVNCKDQRLSGS